MKMGGNYGENTNEVRIPKEIGNGPDNEIIPGEWENGDVNE